MVNWPGGGDRRERRPACPRRRRRWRRRLDEHRVDGDVAVQPRLIRHARIVIFAVTVYTVVLHERCAGPHFVDPRRVECHDRVFYSCNRVAINPAASRRIVAGNHIVGNHRGAAGIAVDPASRGAMISTDQITLDRWGRAGTVNPSAVECRIAPNHIHCDGWRRRAARNPSTIAASRVIALDHVVRDYGRGTCTTGNPAAITFDTITGNNWRRCRAADPTPRVALNPVPLDRAGQTEAVDSNSSGGADGIVDDR